MHNQKENEINIARIKTQKEKHKASPKIEIQRHQARTINIDF